MAGEKDTPSGSDGEFSSKMDQIESIITVLSQQQRILDGLGFSLACIHLNESIEALRLDLTQLESQL
ncbi:MAG: hypothetical protein HOO99_00420 [Hyphomicrobiaceae bacterium]|nr:hypothetical protein [Hyphomicrobiaceae bacterium]